VNIWCLASCSNLRSFAIISNAVLPTGLVDFASSNSHDGTKDGPFSVLSRPGMFADTSNSSRNLSPEKEGLAVGQALRQMPISSAVAGCIQP
jgi:hypothetical protein